MRRTDFSNRTYQIRSNDFRFSIRSFRLRFRNFKNSKNSEIDIVTLFSSLSDEFRRALLFIFRFNVLFFLYDIILNSFYEFLSFRDIIFTNILIMINSHDALSTSDD